MKTQTEMKKLFMNADIKPFVLLCKSVMVDEDNINVDTFNFKATASCESTRLGTMIRVNFKGYQLVMIYNHDTSKWLNNQYIDLSEVRQ